MTRWRYLLVWGLLASVATLVQAQGQATAVIYPVAERELAFAVNGLVVEVPLTQGARVTRGETVMRLDQTAQRLEVERRRLVAQDTTERQNLQARAAILEEQLASLRRLYNETGSVSRDELNGLELQLLDIRNQLDRNALQGSLNELEYELSQASLHDLTLRSPINGIVTGIARDPGEWATAGEPVVELVDLSVVELRLRVRDRVARQLTTGDELTVSISGLGQRLGTIERIAPTADPASGLVEVRLEVANPEGKIRPGTQGNVRLP